MVWRRECRHRDPTVRRRTDRRPRSLAGLNPPGWELSFRDALIRGNSQQRDCEYPCKMTHTISASSTRHPVAPLGYSAPWPAATVEAKVVKCCWKMTLHCCRFVQCSCGSWPWQMGAGHGVGLQRKSGSVVLCVCSSAITQALHGGLPCLGSGER